MKIVRWSFNNLHVPMMEGADGNLFCTTKTLAEVLGLDEKTIRSLPERRPEDFEGLNAHSMSVNAFLKENKTELGILRVRKDMKLWSEDEMFMAAVITRSSVGTQFRRELLKYGKQNAKKTVLEEYTKNYVPREEHDRVIMELGRQAVRLESLERLLTPDKAVKLRLVQ